MSNVTGEIVNFSQRDWKGKTMHSVLMNVNGSENWFGMGDKSPDGFNKGDLVSFEVEQRGKYSNVKNGQLKLVQKGSAPAAGGASGGAREGYWQEKAERDLINDARYNMRAAQMFAKDIVLAAYAKGEVAVPAKKDVFEVLCSNIDMIADDYYHKWMALSLDDAEEEEGEFNPVPDEQEAF